MGGKCLLHPVLVPFRESWPTPFQCCGQLSHFRRASFRDLQGKENAAVHLRIAFLVVATFLNPIQLVAELPLAPGCQFISYKCGVTIE